MARVRKYYRPRSTATKTKISAGVRRYHALARAAIALLPANEWLNQAGSSADNTKEI
jgi:hypothetical protein